MRLIEAEIITVSSSDHLVYVLECLCLAVLAWGFAHSWQLPESHPSVTESASLVEEPIICIFKTCWCVRNCCTQLWKTPGDPLTFLRPHSLQVKAVPTHLSRTIADEHQVLISMRLQSPCQHPNQPGTCTTIPSSSLDMRNHCESLRFKSQTGQPFCLRRDVSEFLVSSDAL